MADDKRQIFREQSLEKLSSPDRLDEMLRIVNPPAWIVLGTMAAGLLFVLLWGVFGRIPSAVNGNAILVRPKLVVGFQSPAAGSVDSIAVAVGEPVEERQVLARLYLPVLEKQLREEELKREQFLERSTRLTELERKRVIQEQGFLANQRERLEDRIRSVEEAALEARRNDVSYILQQRENVAHAQVKIDELTERLEEQYQSSRELFEDKGRVSREQVLSAQRAQVENELRLAELEVKRSEIDLRDSVSLENLQSQMDLVKDLELQLNELDLREMVISNKLEEFELLNDVELQEINRTITLLEKRLDAEGVVRSEYAGRVLEVTVAEGQHVSVGQRLGKIEIDDEEAPLMALAYFQIKDGKKLQRDLAMRVSPATVERERFGAILGKVADVSDYPVTTEAAANQIGDIEIARHLLGGTACIEVLADLEEDDSTPTSYAWTSGDGPDDQPITAGTTAQVRVTINERRPITLLLPFLKSLFGS